tara:strand:+ start:7008 stop:10589 length:3582 start_codon:yes stop_codon:yes gene_type:complete
MTGVTINWETRVISVAKDYLTPTANPTIFNLDTNTFRLDLKGLEDDEDGIAYPDTHQHNTEVPLGGIIYARVIEIINGYTITFENDFYAVNLFGSNNNIGDVVNLNFVSIRTNNSAGLIVDPSISESLDYGEHVIYNEVSGTTGDSWPVGTYASPVNNNADLQSLLTTYGRAEVLCLSDITLTQNFSDTAFISKTGDEVFNPSGFTANNCSLDKMVVEGDFNHSKIFATECSFNNIDNVGGTIFSSILFGDIILTPQYQLVLNKCSSTKPGTTPVIIDMVIGQETIFGTRGHSGPLSIIDCDTTASTATIIFESGDIILNNTCSDGLIVLGGIASILDNSTTGCTVDITGAIDPDTSNTIAYSNRVTIKSGTTNTGISFPVGTNGIPVNNLADAILIAVERGLTILHIHGDWVFPNGTFLNGYTITGDGLQTSTFTFEIGAVMLNCNIQGAKLTGDITGIIGFKNAHLFNIGSTNMTPSSQDILIEDCLMDGTMSLTPTYSGEIRIINCKSAISGVLTPTFDISNSNSSIAIRDYTGGMKLINSNQTGFTASIDMISGNVILEETVSGGTISIRGISNLNDGSTNGVTVTSTGLVEPERINTIAYNDNIHIDSGSTISGTSFPAGTQAFPVNNVADAVTISLVRGIDVLHFLSDFNFPNGTFLDGYSLIGDGSLRTNLTFESGSILLNCDVSSARVTGFETGIIGFEDCLIDNLGSVGLAPSSVSVSIDRCFIKGITSIPSNYSGVITVVDSWAIPDSNGLTPTLDMGDASMGLEIRNLSGFLNLINCTQDNDVNVFLNSGGIILDPTCTDGNFTFTGVGNLINNSTGTKIDSLGLVQGGVIDDTRQAIALQRPHHVDTGKTIYWNPLSGNDTYNGKTVALAVQTFTAAHDLADDGGHDVIIALSTGVGQTVVDDTITISKNYLFLRGPGRDFKIKPTSTSADTITISGVGVEISGIVVDTAATGSKNSISISTGADFFYLNNLWSDFSADMAVHISGTTVYGIIDWCVITDPVGHGVHLEGNILHTKISNTQVNGSGSDGIRIEGTTATDTIIENVKIYGGGAYGIRIEAPSERTFISDSVAIYDNVSGSIIDNGINTIYGTENTANAVWDVVLSAHTINGSTGEALASGGGGSFTGNTQEIALAVWDVLTSSGNTDGSFGKLLNDLTIKADLHQHTLNVNTDLLNNKPNNP